MKHIFSASILRKKMIEKLNELNNLHNEAMSDGYIIHYTNVMNPVNNKMEIGGLTIFKKCDENEEEVVMEAPRQH